jgi:hypothetical protein
LTAPGDFECGRRREVFARPHHRQIRKGNLERKAVPGEVLQVILRACGLIRIERAAGRDVFEKLASRPMPGTIPDKSA